MHFSDINDNDTFIENNKSNDITRCIGTEYHIVF